MDILEIKRLIKKYKIYCYALYKEDSQIFYVGIGTKRRVLDHLCMSENFVPKLLKDKIIKKEISQGRKITAKILGFFDNYSEAAILEKKLIKHFGRINNRTGILSNMTDGGEGCNGLVVSDETKEYFSKLYSGKKVSEETKLKMSLAAKGRERSESHRKNLGKANSKVPIVCVETGDIFSSLIEAEVWLKCMGIKGNRKNIHRSIKQPHRRCGGYHWKYLN